MDTVGRASARQISLLTQWTRAPPLLGVRTRQWAPQDQSPARETWRFDTRTPWLCHPPALPPPARHAVMVAPQVPPSPAADRSGRGLYWGCTAGAEPAAWPGYPRHLVCQ